MHSLPSKVDISISTNSKSDIDEAPEAISTSSSSDDDDSTSTNSSSVGVASSSGGKKSVADDDDSSGDEESSEKESHNIIKSSSDTTSNQEDVQQQQSTIQSPLSPEEEQEVEQEEEGILILPEELSSSSDVDDYVAIPPCFLSNELSNGFMLDNKVALLYQRCSIANSKRLQMFNTTTSSEKDTMTVGREKKSSWKEELDEFRLFISH